MKTLSILLLTIVTTISIFGQKLPPAPIVNPSALGSIQPNWSATDDGAAVLSWIEPVKDGAYSLRYAVMNGTTWSEPHTIVTGRHFFRHPAEAPGVIKLKTGQWIAHWIEMPDESSEAEYVYVSSSTDGLHWNTPTLAHHDRSQGEHGLASMIASGPSAASLVWLEMLKGEDGPAYLMRTVLDASGKEVKEERLDADVCTCCPTSIAQTSKGLIVAYRDHTPQDIRDISVVRFENGRWSQPQIVHADNWKINACPTNAASVVANGNRVALAWYTGAKDLPKVQIAFSEDAGATFSNAVLVSTGHAFGYTSMVMNEDGQAIVSWLERATDGSARLLVRSVSPKGNVGTVSQIASDGRQSLGYPRLVRTAKNTYIAWGKSGSKLQIASVN